MDTGAWWATVHWVTRVGHDLVTKQPPPPQNIIPVINIHIRGKHPWNKLMFTIKVFTMKMIALLPNITLSTTVSPSPSWLEKSSPVTGENRLPRWLSGNLPANTGDLGSVPGSGRSPGKGNGNSLQYSCLENPMDRGAWRLQSMGLQRVRYDLATK